MPYVFKMNFFVKKKNISLTMNLNQTNDIYDITRLIIKLFTIYNKIFEID